MARKRTAATKGQVGADLRRDRAVRLLARGWSVRRVAEHEGVVETTVSAWLGEPGVREQVEALRANALEEARRILTEAASDAADTIRDFAGGDMPQHNAGVQLKAACAILDRVGLPATKVIETEDASGLSDEALQRRAAEILSRGKGGTGDGGCAPAAT